MSLKDNIIILPNPHLRRKSKKVGVVNDSLKQIIEGMKKSTLDWEQSRPHEVGVALAAIQIDKPYRIVIIRNNPDDKKDNSFSVLINPKIIKLEGEITEDYEGCLSVKDLYGKVPRHHKVKIAAQDEHGNSIRVKAEGFLARVLQHEIDHTNGLVFSDRIKDLRKNLYRLTDDGKLKKIKPDDEAVFSILR